MSTPILFNSGDTLFQYFSKQHLDRNNQLSEEEWEDFEYTVEGEEFQAFQIKIVMKSKSQAKVPLIKDLRAIAFAS